MYYKMLDPWYYNYVSVVNFHLVMERGQVLKTLLSIEYIFRNLVKQADLFWEENLHQNLKMTREMIAMKKSWSSRKR